MQSPCAWAQVWVPRLSAPDSTPRKFQKLFSFDVMFSFKKIFCFCIQNQKEEKLWSGSFVSELLAPKGLGLRVVHPPG